MEGKADGDTLRREKAALVKEGKIRRKNKGRSLESYFLPQLVTGLKSPFFIGGYTLIVFYLAMITLLRLLYGSLRNAPIGEPGAVFIIQNYITAYTDKEFYLLFWSSFRYAIGTSTLTFLIGTYLAWLSERTNTIVQEAVHCDGFDPLYHSRDLDHDCMGSFAQP